MKDKHAAEDIWHLTIDDLLAPPPETPRLGGPGPFVINLSASTAPIAIPPKNVLSPASLHVYQVTRTEDGRQRFRLRLGPISTELEADALLANLRERYPGAMIATAADDDLRAIASAARIAETGTRPALKPPPKSPARPQARRLPIPSKPVVKNEALESTGSGWDLDALLPHLAAKTPAPPTNKAPPKKPVEARPVAAAPAPSPQVAAARATPAPRAKPPIAPAAKAAAPAKKVQAPVMKPVSAPPAAGHSAPTEWYEATQPINAAPAAEIPVVSIPVLSIPVLRNEVMPGTGEIVPTVVIEKAQAPQSTPAVLASPVIEPVAVIAAPEPVVPPEPVATAVAPESVKVVAVPEPVVAVAIPEPVAVVVAPTVIDGVATSRVDVEAVAAVAAAPATPVEVVPVPTFTSIGQEFGPSAFGHKVELTGRFAQVEPATQPQNSALAPLPDPLETDWAAILSAPIDATGTRPALGALLESAVVPATVTPAMAAPAAVTPAPTVAPAPVASDDDSGLTNLVARSNALVESLDSQFDPAATLPATIAADPVTVEPAVVAPAAVEPIVVAALVDEFVAVEPPAFTSTQTIEQKLATLTGILAEVEALPATPAPIEMRAPVMPMPAAIEPASVAIAPTPVAVESTLAASSAATIDASAQTGRVPVLQSPVEDIDVDISFDDDLLSAVPLRAHPWPEIERRQEPRPSLKSPTDVLSAIEDMIVVDEANNLENLVDQADAAAVSNATHAEAPAAIPAPAASLPAASVPTEIAPPVETTPLATAAPVETMAPAAPAPVEHIVAATSVPTVEAAQPSVAPIVVDDIVVEELSVDIASSVEVLMLKTSAVLDALDAPAKAVTPLTADRVPALLVEPVPAPTVDGAVAPVGEADAGSVEHVEPTVVLEPRERAPAPVAIAPAPEPVALLLAPVAVVPAPEPFVLSLAPDVVPATPAAKDDTPAWAASSIDLELVPDAPVPSQQAKNNVVPPGAVRDARPAKKARSAGKPARPASTIVAPAKTAVPVMPATQPAAPAHAAAAKSAPPATKVTPPTGRPQVPAKSAKPHAPAHAAMPAPAAAQARTAKPAERKATIDSRPAPAVDSTQTLHALAPLDLAADDASRWFVVQLELSQNEIDPEHVPSLDIFEAYRLYTVMGLIDGKLMHALRLGFFNDDISAQAVGAYLKSFFEAPAIKRVSSAERERFAERQVVPRKDVGATGMHSVIEMSSPRPVPEKRLADLAEGSSQRAPEEKSIWSRLVAPLKR
jgi:hypothetical protein